MTSPSPAEKPFNVLFLCTANSARSILAEALLNKEGQDRFRGFSAGSFPKGEVHPLALAALRGEGINTEGLRSKSWEEFAAADAPRMDFVFTVCDNAANEPCPVWPGHPMTAHWGLPDPAAAEGDAVMRQLAFADTLRMLRNRIRIFTSLPFKALDEMSLRNRLREIGRDQAQNQVQIQA